MGIFFAAYEIALTLWAELRKRPLVCSLFAAASLLLFLRIAVFIVSMLSAGPPRFPIEGTVTLDGVPLDVAIVSFESVIDKRPAAVAYVHDGKFDLPGKHGLKAGVYTVRITKPATDYAAWNPIPAPKKKASATLPQPVASKTPAASSPLVIPSMIPGRYNTASTLAVNVGRWTSRRFEWDLSSSP